MRSVAKPLQFQQDVPLTDEEIDAIAAPIRASLQQGAIPPSVGGAKFLRMVATLESREAIWRNHNGRRCGCG